MSVDPFFNDRATIGVFERAFYAGHEAAEEVEAILEWRARPRRVLDVCCNAGLHALEWARRCPNPMPGDSELEIRQVFEADDFGAEFTPELRAQEERLRAQAANG